MATSAYVRFKPFTIDAVSRTPITVLVSAKSMVIRNTDIAKDATLYDADSGGDSIALPAGGQHTLPAERATRYALGETVLWADVGSGVGSLNVEYHP